MVALTNGDRRIDVIPGEENWIPRKGSLVVVEICHTVCVHHHEIYGDMLFAVPVRSPQPTILEKAA